MKRTGRLMHRVYSWRNLLLAAARARRGKRSRPNVAQFEFHQETELLALQRQLQSGRYEPGPFRTFTIFEPKRREISVAPYRDRVVHHAVCNLLSPVFEPTFIHESFACRIGKGTHAAVDLAQRLMRRFPYVLKTDIARFFPTIDHEVLLGKLARKLKDRELLRLLEVIVRHPFPAQQPCPLFPGDHLFTRLERTCGLPIGNQTSQFFGNVMLNAFDHFVKENLRAPGYVRYVDDFLVFGQSTAELRMVCDEIRQFLQVERLRLNPSKTVISRSADGVRFLGYHVTPTGRSLPRQTRVRFRRRLTRWQLAYARGELTQAEIGLRLAGWLGHARHARCEPWLSRLLERTVFVRSSTVDSTIQNTTNDVREETGGESADGDTSTSTK